jgi:signal transduction histidine kinase
MTGGWPLVGVFACALLGQSLRAGRRRSAINRALHELRRPLQAMALGGPGVATTADGAGSLGLAIAALAQLDAEVNRRPPPDDPAPARCADLLEAAAARWRERAVLAGKSIALQTPVRRDIPVAAPAAVAQAVDNLIANAIQHGGTAIVVEASRRGGRIRITVADDGRGFLPPRRHALVRLSGRHRRGHGLEVVRRVAAAQGGRFVLRRSEAGTAAHLELPVFGDDARAA